MKITQQELAALNSDLLNLVSAIAGVSSNLDVAQEVVRNPSLESTDELVVAGAFAEAKDHAQFLAEHAEELLAKIEKYAEALL